MGTSKAAEVRVYRRMPKSAYRRLRLGILDNGAVRVVAGIVPPKWWDTFPQAVPVIVAAKILAVRAAPPVAERNSHD